MDSLSEMPAHRGQIIGQFCLWLNRGLAYNGA